MGNKVIANTPMDYDKIKIYGSRVTVTKFAEIEQAEKEKMKNKVKKILEYGCDIFINRKLIYNYREQLIITDKGIWNSSFHVRVFSNHLSKKRIVLRLVILGVKLCHAN